MEKYVANSRWYIVLLITTFCVGGVYVMPHAVRFQTLASHGQSYMPLTQEADFDTMNIQGGRYRDILDGDLIPGEIDIYEYADAPAMWPLLSATILAPFILVSGSVMGGVVISDFLFPAVLFFLLYMLFYALTSNRLFSIIAAVMTLLVPDWSLVIPPGSVTDVKVLLGNLFPLPFSKNAVHLAFLRREAFIPGGPFFILTLLLIYRTITSRTYYQLWAVSAGLAYGLLFYLYFYFWVFISVFLGVLLFVFMARREKASFFTIFIAGAVGVCVSVPFWLNYYELIQLPQYIEFTERAGIELGRAIQTAAWKTLLLSTLYGLWGYFLFREQKRYHLRLFLIAIAASEILVLNLQVVTGFNIQSDHWATRVFILTHAVLFIALVHHSWYFVRSRTDILTTSLARGGIYIVAILLTVITGGTVISTEVIRARSEAHAYTLRNDLADAYTWLTLHTSPESVVVSPALETNIDLPVYTHNRIFIPRGAATVAPEEEIVNRLLYVYSLLGIPVSTLEEVLNDQQAVFRLFALRYDSRALDVHLKPDKYPKRVFPSYKKREILEYYQLFKKTAALPYRADYLFIGPHERKFQIQKEQLSQFTKIYKNEGVEIYMLR